MLNNKQIAQFLIRGREVNSSNYIVGTGVRISQTKARIYDETIPQVNQRWVKVIPDTIEKCIGLVDAVGTPIFDNDVLHHTQTGVTIIVKYNKYELRWEAIYVFDKKDYAGDISVIVGQADKLLVSGHYTNGVLDERVKYNKVVLLEAYNDCNL